MSERWLYILIAMWLWCASAAGETLSISLELFERDNGTVLLAHPCNWDQDLDKVSATAFYGATDTELIKMPIEPTSKKRSGRHIHFTFASTVSMYNGLPLHHIDVDMSTTGETCKQDFGFKQGNFVR